MKLRRRTAKQLFKSHGKNFMTPEVLGYRDRGAYAVELSTGTGIYGESLFGVTVIDRDTEKPLHDLSCVFRTKPEALVYIDNLPNRGNDNAARSDEAAKESV